jgi:DNA polymerase-3 subunit alpha
MERAQKRQRDRQSGQASFGILGDREAETGLAGLPGMPEVDEWPEHKLLAYEKETLGFYISGHPLAKFASRLEELAARRAESLEEGSHGEEVRLAGLVSGVRHMRSRKGDRWAIVTLEDMTGIAELLVFPEAFGRLENLLKTDTALLVKGKLNIEDAGTRVVVSDAKPLEDVAVPAPSMIRIHVDPDALGLAGVESLRELFASRPGSCRVAFELDCDGYRATMETGQQWRVNPDRELVERLREICGRDAVQVIR